MPFNTTDRLMTLLNTALLDPDIKTTLLQTAISRENVINYINNKTDELWASASEINTLDVIEEQIDMVNTRIDLYDKKIKRFIARMGNFTAVSVLITFLFWSIKVLGSSLSSQLVFHQNWLIIIFSILPILSLLLFVSVAVSDPKTKMAGLTSHLGALLYPNIKHDIADSIELSFDLHRLKESYTEISEKAEQKILETSLKPIIREYLNGILLYDYSKTLSTISVSGLGEAQDTSRTISTSAVEELTFLLNHLPGGSIGIAGPRGAGKSTLTRLFCGKNRIVDKIGTRKVIPVLTSAPVQYDGREFIIHLFSQLCLSYLSYSGFNYDTHYEQRRQDVWQRSRRIKLFLILLGIIRRLYFWGWLLILTASIYLLSKIALLANMQLEYTADIVKFWNELMPLSTGSALIIGALIVGLHRPTGKKQATVVSLTQELTVMEAELWESAESKWKPWEQSTDSQVLQAGQWIQRLRYQLSYSKGTTNGIKLPFGIERGMSKGATYSYNQLTTPEIVGAFGEFLDKIPRETVVLIGIDELDKIEDEKMAHKFLNEIKSLFGSTSCFFLVTVSENAMASFDRRGLAFRDVFDSSFDSVVYIDYLTWPQSVQLLQRRVIGNPMSFFALSYCLSGGLPREIIRVFREIVRLKLQNGTQSLTLMVDEIVRAELHRKFRALSFAVKSLRNLPFADQLLNIFERASSTPSLNIFDYLPALAAMLEQIKTNLDSRIDNSSNDLPKAIDLIEEAIAYSYFLDSITYIFTYGTVEDSGSGFFISDEIITTLARSRQLLSVDPSLAVNLLTQTRVVYNLQILSIETRQDNTSTSNIQG